MTVLDTFYILFNVNGAATKQQISDIDKQLDTLGAKGKKRSLEEEKEYKELQKQRKQTVQDLKEQQNQVDKVGQSFANLATTGLAALTAFASFHGIKSGVLDAAKLNSNLEIQAKITGQNVDELRAYSGAVESAGGDASSFTQLLYAQAQAVAQNGVQFKNVGAFLDSINAQIQGLPPAEKLRVLGNLGITDPGSVALLIKTTEEYHKAIDAHRKLTAATHEDYEAARSFESALADTGQSLTRAFTHLGTDVFPGLSTQLGNFSGYLGDLEKKKGGVEEFFGLLSVGAIVATASIGRLLLVLAPLATAYAGTLAAVAATGVALYYGPEETGAFLGRNINKLLGRGDKNGVLGGTEGMPQYGPPAPGAGDPAVAFWVSQGYTLAQAIGIAANERKESGGRAGARNFQKGTHYGLYQWDESRRANILAGTGIDVASASAEQQRAAAAWELRARGDDARIKRATSPEGAAAITNSYFEVSGENPGDRMRIARQLASTYASKSSSAGAQIGGGDKNITVKIDDVTIQTQATDAAGIFASTGTGLRHEIETAFKNFDDGQDR